MMRFEGQYPLEQRQIVDSRGLIQEPFPDIPQARFEAIFASIGNSESKCATLLNLPHTQPTTASELHQAFKDSTNEAWDLHPSTTQSYCEETFIPIGFVARSEILYYGRTKYNKGYKVTESGLRFGQPIAAFLLQQSTELPYALETLFSMTSRGNGGETRGVINRIRVLEALYEQRESEFPMTNLQISEKLDTQKSYVAGHLKSLRDLGLINFSSISTENKRIIPYSVVGKIPIAEIPTLKAEHTLTRNVAEIMNTLGTADIHTVMEEYARRFPNNKIDGFRAAKVLSFLARHGYIASDFKIGEIHSNSKITEEGIKIVENIIHPIKRALEGDEDLLDEWRGIPWREYAESAVNKHKLASSQANAGTIQEWASEALEIILNNPGIRTTDIGSRIKTNTSVVLKLLFDEGLIRKEKDRKAVRYYAT